MGHQLIDELYFHKIKNKKSVTNRDAGVSK